MHAQDSSQGAGSRPSVPGRRPLDAPHILPRVIPEPDLKTSEHRHGTIPDKHSPVRRDLNLTPQAVCVDFEADVADRKESEMDWVAFFAVHRHLPREGPGQVEDVRWVGELVEISQQGYVCNTGFLGS